MLNIKHKHKKIVKNSMEYLRIKKDLLEKRNMMAYYHPFIIREKSNPYINREYTNTTQKNTHDDCVTVIITTHNRSNVACAVIDSVVQKLHFKNIKWCICDDRSDEGHIQILLNRFYKNNITDVHVCKTDINHYGLGASLNNGLKYAWENGNIVLTLEDDWVLQKDLYLDEYVDILKNDDNISMIRLAYLDSRHKLEDYNENFYRVGKSLFNYIFNNQVAIRHKRIYDLIGYNKENCKSDQQEEDQRNRYNSSTNYGEQLSVLFPKNVCIGTFDDSSLYFVHVGKSTNGHVWYDIPKRYEWIYSNDWLKEINDRKEHEICLITDKNFVNNSIKMVNQIRKFTNTKIYIICWDDECFDSFTTSIDNVDIIEITKRQRKKCINCAGDMSYKKGYFVPPVGLVKFLLPEILKNLNTVLYLDCDIYINKPFNEILYSNIDNYYVSAVPDVGAINLTGNTYVIMQTYKDYFNSGVMLLNLENMRKDGITTKLFETKRNLIYKELMDQDTLNIVLNSKFKKMDNKYNCMLPIIDDRMNNRKEITLDDVNRLYNKSYNKYIDIKNEAVMIHFASGWAKPWKESSPYYKTWLKL